VCFLTNYFSGLKIDGVVNAVFISSKEWDIRIIRALPAVRVTFVASVGLRAAVDSRLLRWGNSAQRGVRVLSAGRNSGSGADSVDAV
jgi:hypothetical protein